MNQTKIARVGKRLVAALLAASAVSVMADQGVDEVADHSFSLPHTHVHLAYFAASNIEEKHDKVTSAVLFVHGIKRNAGKYFADANKIAEAAQVDKTKVLIIAPQFLNDLDGGSAQLLHWHREQWVDGIGSLDDSHTSAFAALDALLNKLAQRELYPALKQIVIAGHSAGGQFVQRYAVLNNQDEALQKKGISLRYVVANPSSYFWFDPERPNGSDFSVPKTTCDYQHFKYGPEQMPDYAQPFNADAARKRYFSRNVVYLLGGADTDPNHPVLDKSCAAELQGPYRLARGLNYLRYGQKVAPNNQQIVNIIPDIGHNDYQMYDAICGRAALFGMVCANEGPKLLGKQ